MKINVEVSQEINEKLKIIAKKDNRSVAGLLRRLIQKYVNDFDKNKENEI